MSWKGKELRFQLKFFPRNWKELLKFKNTGAIREKFPRAKPTVEYIQKLNFRFGIQTTLESGIDVGQGINGGPGKPGKKN